MPIRFNKINLASHLFLTLLSIASVCCSMKEGNCHPKHPPLPVTDAEVKKETNGIHVCLVKDKLKSKKFIELGGVEKRKN